MKYTKSTALLVGLVATMVLSSSAALALKVDATVDKNVVTFGDTIKVTGSITDDEGNPGAYDYRVAAIVAGKSDGGERVIICDSGRQTSGADGAVSFECEIPTLEEMQSLGVENAGDRFAIPLKGGIAAWDPATNESDKDSGKAVIVNKDHVQTKLEAALERIDAFIAKAEEGMARCDNITARAEEAGAEKVIERCGEFQKKMQENIEKALMAQERIQSALGNLENSTYDFDELKESFHGFSEGSKAFRGEVKEVRDFVDKARADLERKVAKEIKEAAMERAKEIRKSALEKEKALKDRLKDLREDRLEIREGKKVAAVGSRMPVPGSDAPEMEVSDDSGSDEGPEDESEDDSDDDSGSGSTEQVNGTSGSG